MILYIWAKFADAKPRQGSFTVYTPTNWRIWARLTNLEFQMVRSELSVLKISDNMGFKSENYLWGFDAGGSIITLISIYISLLNRSFLCSRVGTWGTILCLQFMIYLIKATILWYFRLCSSIVLWSYIFIYNRYVVHCFICYCLIVLINGRWGIFVFCPMKLWSIWTLCFIKIL